MNLQLSDGTTMQIPDDATPEMIKNFSARGEAHIKANPAAPAAAGPQGGADPNSFRNVVGRIASDAVMGLPDLAIAASNAISKPGDYVAEWITGNKPASRDLPTLAPQLRKEWNVAELSEDAPYWQRIAEGAGSGLPYGVLGAGRAALAGGATGGLRGGATAGARELVRNTVVPTVTSDIGAQAGGAVGGPTGALIGGVLGGAAPSARPVAESVVQSRYTGRGKPNAPDIAAAAERLGIEPTAGALGGPEIQARERNYVGNYPQGRTAQLQEQQRGRMIDVGEDIGAQRGGTGASTAAIGDDIAAAVADRVLQDRTYSSAQQENLQRTVGDATQIPITDIVTTAVPMMTSPRFSVPQRQAIQYRLEQHLYPLINRRPDGTPILDAQGNATVPYGALKAFRTDLGRSYEQGRYPRAQELYGPTTEAMRVGATRAGVPRNQFDQVQAYTHGVEGAGGLAERLAPFDKEPGAVYNYALEGGLRNPERVQTFAAETAGDPRQGNVFGSYLQQKVGETLGARTAQGPNKFAQFVEGADPRALATIAGPQAPRLQDLATLARGVNTPTSTSGLTRAVGGVANTLGGKFLGSEAIGQAAGAIDPSLAAPARAAGWLIKPALDAINQRIMQSQAAKRGLTGAPMPQQGMTMEDLVRVLNAISQSQQPPPAQ